MVLGWFLYSQLSTLKLQHLGRVHLVYPNLHDTTFLYKHIILKVCLMPFWYYTHTPTLPFLVIFLLLFLLNIIFCFNIQNMPLLYNIYNSQNIRLTLFNWSSIMSFGSPISNLLINILGFLKSFYNTYKSWIGLGNCSVINSLRNT